MQEDRKQALAAKIGKSPEQVPAVILQLLDVSAADSPICQQIVSDLSTIVDSPPSREDFEDCFVGVAKGIQYVHEQFPGQIIGRFQFVGQMCDELGNPYPPSLSYIPESDLLAMSIVMPAYHAIAKGWGSEITMPYMPRHKFNAAETAFLTGVEEAYHAVQNKNPEIDYRLHPDQSQPRNNEAFEEDAGRYRAQVANQLGMGQVITERDKH